MKKSPTTPPSAEAVASAFEHAATPLFLVAVESRGRFRFTRVNRSFLKATGLNREQVEGRLVREVIPAPSASLVLRHYRAAVRTRRIASWEEVSPYPAGEKHGEVAVTPIVDERGRVRVLSGVVFDVTARNLARRQARESEEMFSKAFHDNPTAMGIRRQRDDAIVAVNRSFERLFGYKAEEVVGRTVDAVGLYLPPARRLALKRRSERAGLVRGFEISMRARDGSVKTILLAVDRIMLNGEPCFLASFVDITQQKKAQDILLEISRTSQNRSRQVEALAAALVSTQQRERRRLAGIVHETLQQQLVAASMQLKLLSKRFAREAAPDSLRLAQELLLEAQETSRSLSHEINPPAPFQAGLSAALRWLAEQMRRMYSLDVRLAVPESLPRLPDSTQGFLFGAVRELLFNAVKHAKARRASVAVLRGRGVLRIEVVNEGAGFDASKLEQELPGMGLLSIRESLGVLGGRLELDASPKGGCRAVLHVPLPRPAR